MDQMPPQIAAVAMADTSPDALFEETIETMRSTMSEDECRACCQFSDISSMLADMHAQCAQDQRNHHRLLSCSRKIAAFSHAFAPYFDIINIFVQIKPQWLAWFWGSVRLVFKMGSNYVLFLEKVADMFEHITHILPQYKHFYEACKLQFQQTQQDRLTTLMSYLYVDIVQFCLEVRRIFARGSPGVKLRHRLSFLVAALGKPLDLQFVQLQERLKQHQQWFDKEMQVQNFDLLAQHRREFLDFIKHQGQDNGPSYARQMARDSKKIDRIKSWLSGPDYREVYEQSVRQRHANTGAWFLSRTEYCDWKNAPFPEATANDMDGLKASWPERVMFIQGKPGYGKTMLSGRIIDDLKNTAEDSNIGSEPPTTIFFHFNSTLTNICSSNEAVRALALQLVHAHRGNSSTLSALGLLIRRTSGQQKASFDDAVSVLGLLLKQHSTFIVVDGVDECSDQETFLSLLLHLCQISDCRAIFLSRPNISIPIQPQGHVQGAPTFMYLDESHNISDIESFITSNLQCMADHGLFGTHANSFTIPALQVGRRANGMFLWATLLINYLRSPGLSPHERRLTLEQASLLEGLESLYSGILAMLSRRFMNEKRIAVDIFRWLSFSIKSLSTEALHAALAIIPGQPTTPEQYLVNFANSVSTLTCALVEVSLNGKVRFIHRSVKEYLMSPACQTSEFSLCDENTVHAHLAARCISYLAYNLPKRPLEKLEPYATSSNMSFRTSRTSSTAATNGSHDSGYRSMSSSDSEAVAQKGQSKRAFDKSFPLLRYASLCWPVHLTRALSSQTQPPSSNLSSITSNINHATPWLPILSQFLTVRLAVTVWVEGSWRYHFPPNLSRLVPLISRLTANTSPNSIQERELRWVVHGLKQLSEALNELRNDYGVTLANNPSLIWQRSIQGATDGMFWPVWDEARGRVYGGEF